MDYTSAAHYCSRLSAHIQNTINQQQKGSDFTPPVEQKVRDSDGHLHEEQAQGNFGRSDFCNETYKVQHFDLCWDRDCKSVLTLTLFAFTLFILLLR